MRRLWFPLFAVVLVVATSSVAGVREPRHVTLIGDSGAGGIPGFDAAIAVLGRGVDLELEVAACRRVSVDSCPIDGVSPPNVVQLAATLGARLGPVVVVAVGYNDSEAQYAEGIEQALAAFRTAGVTRVYWLTMRAARHGYVGMNADIVAAATSHRELRVIDWNRYSRNHPDWFQADGLHPVGEGSQAMAALIHKRLVADGIAIGSLGLATVDLPPARVGMPYATRLAATGGIAPYRWSVVGLPSGLRLARDGLIVGRPGVTRGVYVVQVVVQDADGFVARRRLVLRLAS